MSDLRTFTRSFGGGEVTEEMLGRIDDARAQTALKRCRNFIIKPHGPAQNRCGTEFVGAVKDSTKATRVLPFLADADEGFVVEVGAGYFRFFYAGARVLSGASPYEVANPYAEADLPRLRYVQSNDVMTLVCPGHPPAELRRTAATTFVYAVITFGSAMEPPTGLSATATPAATSPGTPTLQSYVVTAVNGADESAASNDTGGGSTPPTLPTGGYYVVGMTNGSPGVFTIYEVPDPALAVDNTVYLSGFGGTAGLNGKFFKIASATAINDPDPPYTQIGVSFTLKDVSGTPTLDTTSVGTYLGGGTIALSGGGAVSGTGVASCSNNLYDDGAYNTIAWAAVTGAKRYNVYKLSNGLYGFIGQTEGLSFTDDNIGADISKTPPTNDTAFDVAGAYPGAVGYFEQRRWFAGTGDQPANVWSTRSGTESSLSYSIPARDDDSIRFRIAARERHNIRHVVPLSNLVLLSDAAEWVVTPAGADVLTPDVAVRAQSFIGAAEAQPVAVNNNLLFAAARGGHVRELAYNDAANGFITGDVSIRAPHLFDDKTVVEMTYAKSPIPIVWAVSSDGTLLGFTYVPEQQVGAWHWHDTAGGLFESACVVPEGNDDVLYLVVKRGATRFVERMRTRHSNDATADAFFVDCGLVYDGAPATTISGLDHLEGEEVSILADGRVLPAQTVTDGAITLADEAERVVVGIPITHDIETLPLAFEAPAYGQGRPKGVAEVWLKLFRSRSIKAGPSFDRLTAHHPAANATVGAAPPDRTSEIRLKLSASWSQEGTVCLRHDEPLPLTILAMTTVFAVGG